MFLKRVYKENPWLFLLFVGFIILQTIVFVDLRITFSPCYKYGMFSHHYTDKDTVSCINIYVEGKRLRSIDYSPPRWDNFIYPIEAIKKYEATNNAISENLHYLFGAGYTTPVNPKSKEDMWKSYEKHLPYISGLRSIDNFKVVSESYVWRGRPIRVKSTELYAK